jgi:hypothetical protein
LPEHKKALYLKKDIVRSVHCIFNDHTRCASDEICTEKDRESSENLAKSLKLTPMWEKIMQPLQRLINNASSLMANKDSNIVESANSVIAKMTANKGRLFVTSYDVRVRAAVISFNNKGKVHSRVCRQLFQRTPGSHTKRMEMRRHKNNHPATRKPRRKLRFSAANNGNGQTRNNKFYNSGNCSEPILSGEALESSCLARLESFKKSADEIIEIEKNTKDQSDCPAWRELHCNMLTASNHGAVCKRRENTSCKNQVYQFLYADLSHVNSIEHGNKYENTARELLAEKLGKKIDLAGMFISEEYPFLGASPDGLIGSDTVVEIKCPLSAANMSPVDAVLNGTISYIDAEKIQRKKGKKQQDQYEFSMKKKHNYYYQIQSQLHYSNREKCIFAVYTLIEPCILAIEVKRDESFYAQMEPKLVKFFMGCMLPEIVSPMYPRQKEKKDIREPQYILDAMNELSLRRR